MNPDNQIPVVLPAISLDNLLLFILCTPVQVCRFFLRISSVAFDKCEKFSGIFSFPFYEIFLHRYWVDVIFT